jgi:hypothetical protein
MATVKHMYRLANVVCAAFIAACLLLYMFRPSLDIDAGTITSVQYIRGDVHGFYTPVDLSPLVQDQVKQVLQKSEKLYWAIHPGPPLGLVLLRYRNGSTLRVVFCGNDLVCKDDGRYAYYRLGTDLHSYLDSNAPRSTTTMKWP